MLILTRHFGKTVMIGDEVTVTVLGMRGNQVRLGSMRRSPLPSIEKRCMSASSSSNGAALRHGQDRLAWMRSLLFDLADFAPR
jgi:hypothetical protein